MKTQLRTSFLKHSVITGKIREKSNTFPGLWLISLFLATRYPSELRELGHRRGAERAVDEFRAPMTPKIIRSLIGSGSCVWAPNSQWASFLLPPVHSRSLFFWFRPPYALTPTFRISTNLTFSAFLSNLKEKLGRPCYCIVNRWRCCRIFIFWPTFRALFKMLTFMAQSANRWHGRRPHPLPNINVVLNE
jgi:hypothetical protein